MRAVVGAALSPGNLEIGRGFVSAEWRFKSSPGGFLKFSGPPGALTPGSPQPKPVYGVSAAPVKAVTLSHLHGLHAKEPVVNTLSIEKQTQILSLLVEGSSIRSIERVTGVHRDTIVRLLARAGTTCARLMDEKVTDLKCEDVEVDEIWGYVAKKQRHIQPQDNPHEVGDQSVFIAMDAKSKSL